MATYSPIVVASVTLILLNTALAASVEPVKIIIRIDGGEAILLETSTQLRSLESRLHDARQIDMALSCTEPCENEKLLLRRSPGLLAKQLKVKYFDKNDRPVHDTLTRSEFGCTFSGHVEGKLSASSAYFQLCNGRISGTLKTKSRITKVSTTVSSFDDALEFHAHARIDNSKSHHVCGYKPSHGNTSYVRSRRDVRLPALRNSTTRYIELYTVANHDLYMRSGSVAATVKRLVDAVNYASALYQGMNIYLVLVGVEVWSNSDKVSVDQPVDNVLQDFQRYRQNQISPNTPNDDAQLFVGDIFQDNVIGRGSTTICELDGGVAVIADLHDDDVVTAATTMAHELGHNLGLDHDDEITDRECVCPRPGTTDIKCIMHASTDG